MAKGDTLVWIVLGLLAVFFFFPGVFSGFGLGTGTTTTTGTTAGTCFDDSLSFVSDDVRKDLLATNPGLSYRLFVGNKGSTSANIDKGNNADAATVTVPTDAPYMEVAGWNAGTDTLVYRQRLEGNTDCTDPLTIQPVLAYGEANLTAYIVDKDGTSNTDGAYAAAAGDDLYGTMTVQASSNFYWSNPYITSPRGIVVIQYNTTHIDEVRVPSLSAAPVPDIARNNGSNWNRKAFYVPSIAVNKDAVFRFEYDIKDGKEPIANPDLLYFEFYDANIDLNADTNALIEDVEDEDNNNLGVVDSLNRFKHDVS